MVPGGQEDEDISDAAHGTETKAKEATAVGTTQLQRRKPAFVQRIGSLFVLLLYNTFVPPLGEHMDTNR